ncbi:hypothetical protein ACFQ46_23405 [Kineococcus sp. GCM10028916]|uniref:hypothetical protein n=1 Tax=Kineococcus sp. GCM10028916 TaxID=3273394 RepID=UPI003628D99F
MAAQPSVAVPGPIQGSAPVAATGADTAFGARAPQSLVRAGKHKTLTGAITRVQDEDDATTDPVYLSSGDTFVRLTGDLVASLRPGATVTLTVTAAGAVDGVDTDAVRILSVDAVQSQRTLKSVGSVEHPVTVALVAPAGTTPTKMTVADVAPMLARASAYWNRQSGGQVNFTLRKALDWRTSATACEDVSALWQEELNVIGQSQADYINGTEHLLIVAPAAGSCSYGLGTVGDAFSGGLAFVTGTDQSVVAHELGHNLGLDHAGSVSAPASSGRSDVTFSDTGIEAGARFDPYGDTYDVMGYSGSTSGMGNLNVVHRDQLGLFPQQQREITTPQTVTIRGLGVDTGDAPKSIKVVDGATAYYLEYRSASGDDALVAGRSTTTGVRVLRATPWGAAGYRSRQTVVFDPTPTQYADDDMVVAPGKTWSTVGADLHFQVLSAQGDTAQVKIVYGAAPAPITVATPVPTPGTGTGPGVNFEVAGVIAGAYLNSGAQTGPLGQPVSNQFGLRNGGSGQHFQGGSIYWSPSSGAQIIKGSFRDKYASMGWETSYLGYPTSGEMPVRGGVIQRFQGGIGYWSPATGAQFIRGAIFDKYGAFGWEGGRLGFPVISEVGLRTGAFTAFQGGSIYWHPTSGAHPVFGAIRDTWGASGWENGPLGFPTSDEFGPLRGGGFGQRYQGGSIYWSLASGGHTVTGAFRGFYAAQGWEGGRLGYPISQEYRSGSLIKQDYQGGTLTWDGRATSLAWR